MESTGNHFPRRLYKSRQNRMIDGVCGGIGEFFGIDATIVRILWVLITLLGGVGIFLYIAAMIIMPANPDATGQSVQSQPNVPVDKRRFWGVLLVLVGAFMLLLNLGWIANLRWWSISSSVVLPILLILAGLGLIYSFTQRREVPAGEGPGGSPEQASTGTPVIRELRRSITDRKIFGVCGGLGQYFSIDSTIVRILFILLVLASFGWGLLLYIILAIVMPEEKPSSTTIPTG